MSQKTDLFKNTQTPLWEDGDLANGANFRQLIAAIATLVDETRGELVDTISSGSVDTEALTQQVLGSLTPTINNLKSELTQSIDDKNNTQTSALRNDMDSRVNSVLGFVTSELNKYVLHDEYAEQVGSLASRLSTYRYDGIRLVVNSHIGEETYTPEDSKGKGLLQETMSQNLRAIPIGNGSIILIRPDGAQLLFIVDTNTIKPVPNLIG